MKNKEQQIEFMEKCQERIQGYVASWMRRPFFREAFRHRSEEPTATDQDSDRQ